MRCGSEDKRHPTELTELAKPLELRSVDHLYTKVVEFDVTMNRIIKDLIRHDAAQYVRSIRPYAAGLMHCISMSIA